MAQVFTVSLFEFGPEQNGVRFNYITRVPNRFCLSSPRARTLFSATEFAEQRIKMRKD